MRFRLKLRNIVRRYLPILLLSLSLSNCSLRTTALKFLDTIILFEIDEMFDLRSEQKDAINPYVQKIIQWLKEKERNEIIRSLEYLVQSLDGGLTTSEYNEFRKKMADTLSRMVVQITPGAKVLAASLSDEQIKHFSEFLEETNERYVELSESTSFKDDRIEQIESRIEKVYGSATEKQVDAIYKVTRGQSEVRRYLAQRRASQEYSLELLRAGRKDGKTIEKLLATAFTNPRELRPKDMRQEYDELGRLWNNLWVATDQQMTDKQRAKAKETITDLITDIKEWQ